MEQALHIRPATADDLEALREIYAGVVAELGPTAYSSAQVHAWKAFAAEPAFAEFILDVHTYVAEINNEIAAFCGISGDGYVASVYVKAARCGQGIGTKLLNEVLARHPEPASGRLYAAASAFSLPLFMRCGFVHTGNEETTRGDVVFERYQVEKQVRT